MIQCGNAIFLRYVSTCIKNSYDQEDLPAEHEGKPSREDPHRMLPAKLHSQGSTNQIISIKSATCFGATYPSMIFTSLIQQHFAEEITQRNHGVASSLTWSNSTCNLEIFITRPRKTMRPFKSANSQALH